MCLAGFVGTTNDRDTEGEARTTGDAPREEIGETMSAGRAARHPWRCKLG
jgi:hypothetical protein